MLALLLGTLMLVSTSVAQDMPDWMTVDTGAKTVAIEVIAGKTDAMNHWNFNGYMNGNATIVVPEGYAVTLTFKNNDPVMAHSVGIGEAMATYPPMFDDPQPAFAGAISSNPTDMVGATMPGKSEVLTFTADKAGDYVLICYIPAHATTGMWIHFKVSADGTAGLIAG